MARNRGVLFPGQSATDRHDLRNNVFRMKHKLLLSYLKDDHPFGKTVADVSVIEFQKRSLVHADIILFVEEEQMKALENIERVNEVVSE